MTAKHIHTPYDYDEQLECVAKLGRHIYGKGFTIDEVDKPVINRLLCYFMQDKKRAEEERIDLQKGVLLMGPTGCGKTALMHIMARICYTTDKPVFRSCNEVTIDFNNRGYESINQYTKGSFVPYTGIPCIYCFDDLGLEPPGHHYGSSSNVMAEILLSRYNYFISRKMITHITTNMNSAELEVIYGNRIRSRMREMFNQIIFSNVSKDKRQ
jgi:energy-coupling factor transporter ATP-binding protein EcfA2